MQTLRVHLDRDELASKLGGGIPKGSLVCIEGPVGAGKSVLCQRLAYGLLGNGHSLAYVSTELTTQGFAAQMASLDYRVEATMIRGDLLFIPVFPMVAKRAQGDLLGRLASGTHLFQREALFVDTFTKLAQESSEVLTPAELRRRLEELLHYFKQVTALGGTIVLALEPEPELEAPFRSLRDAADLLIGLEVDKAGNAVTRRLVVQRMSRAAGRFADVLSFRVEPGVGLVVEIKSVV